MKVKQVGTKELKELVITEATLLSCEEAKSMCKRLRKFSDCWWLKDEGTHKWTALIHVHPYDSKHNSIVSMQVDLEDVSVRPALKIEDVECSGFKIGDCFVFGHKEFEIISESLAFCKESIGQCCFREDNEAKDAGNYNFSFVKKFIDFWFDMNCEDTMKKYNSGSVSADWIDMCGKRDTRNPSISYGFGYGKCSNCNRVEWLYMRKRFCPNCGSRMKVKVQ